MVCRVVLCCTGEWESSCNELQRMLLVRSLRQDRVAFCVTSFIVNNLGSKFVEPPVLDLRQVVDDSTAKTPLIFVLSPGVVSRSICLFSVLFYLIQPIPAAPLLLLLLLLKPVCVCVCVCVVEWCCQ